MNKKDIFEEDTELKSLLKDRRDAVGLVVKHTSIANENEHRVDNVDKKIVERLRTLREKNGKEK